MRGVKRGDRFLFVLSVPEGHGIEHYKILLKHNGKYLMYAKSGELQRRYSITTENNAGSVGAGMDICAMEF